VICQIVLAMIVLVPAGLTSKSLSLILRENPGFQSDHLLTAELALPLSRYAEAAQRRAFYDQLLERLRAMPQVEWAAASETIPFGHQENWVPFWIADQPEPAPGEIPGTLTTAATPGYAAALNIFLLRGRFVSDQDGPNTLPVVVISQTLAQRYFADDGALGHKLRLGRDDPKWYTIIGIVRDVKVYSLADGPMSESYTAYAQSAGPSMNLVMRTKGDPVALTAVVRSVVWSLDKQLPLSEIEPLEQRLADQLAGTRIFTQFSGIFALLALFLAGIGIYGVMAYLVESRTREIGIRAACGADRRNIFWLVLSGAFRLAVMGLSIGLLGAWSVARLLMNGLQGISGNQLDVYAAAVAVLCAAVLMASSVPVRRATHVDPLTVLRCE